MNFSRVVLKRMMLARKLELDKHTLKHEVQIIFKHSVSPSKKK